MAVTLTDPAKTASMTGLRDHFAAGTIEILDSGDVLLVTYTLTSAGGSVAAGIWTVGLESASAAAVADGTASKAQFKTAGGVADITGLTVGESATDIIVDSATIVVDQSVTLSTLTIDHD